MYSLPASQTLYKLPKTIPSAALSSHSTQFFIYLIWCLLGPPCRSMSGFFSFILLQCFSLTYRYMNIWIFLLFNKKKFPLSSEHTGPRFVWQVITSHLREDLKCHMSEEYSGHRTTLSKDDVVFFFLSLPWKYLQASPPDTRGFQ